MKTKSLVNQGFGPISRERAEAAFATGKPEEILRALLRLAMNGPDFEYAERLALEYARHDDVWVRRNAATSLGHIARVHGNLDLARVLPALLEQMMDSEVRDWADAALDDIQIYLKVDPRKPKRIGGKRFTYNPERRTLRVSEKGGRPYEYSEVTPQEFIRLFLRDPARDEPAEDEIATHERRLLRSA
ncbi:MAG TPA: hypothetical protein VF746_27105 [Longimicrobium sp.]